MKGVVLAGGTGSRLYPLTKITNKHLLPVYNKPMIYYPIEALVKAGIREIMLVTGGEYASDFARLLGDGREMGVKTLYYAYQEKPLGIAHALSLAEDFVGNEKCVVFLGDNVIEGNIIKHVRRFAEQERGAMVLLKEVPNPQDYGCPVFDGDRIVRIIEKPKEPPSKYAVIGIYFYDPEVFKIIKTLKPSQRGEFEITDVNNAYAERGLLSYDFLDGWWGDCGASIDAWLYINNLVAKTGANKVEL
ncbi:MAG: hypothetical protein HZRFUVUK_001871 [Candidatus Fervidibacterota bacterium]|jgi:glucose-1-phosphate thymidylyltransferase